MAIIYFHHKAGSDIVCSVGDCAIHLYADDVVHYIVGPSLKHEIFFTNYQSMFENHLKVSFIRGIIHPKKTNSVSHSTDIIR